MKTALPVAMELGRIMDGPYASKRGEKQGAFVVDRPSGRLAIISSGDVDVEGWEHVSVSLKHRTPTWEEMCFVKDIFWHEEECVVQYHPPKSDYVNCHPFCLHLWRPVRGRFPRPPSNMVGGTPNI